MTGQYFELLDWLIAKDKKVFVDLKFFDDLRLLEEQLQDLVSMVQLLLLFMVINL